MEYNSWNGFVHGSHSTCISNGVTRGIERKNMFTKKLDCVGNEKLTGQAILWRQIILGYIYFLPGKSDSYWYYEIIEWYWYMSTWNSWIPRWEKRASVSTWWFYSNIILHWWGRSQCWRQATCDSTERLTYIVVKLQRWAYKFNSKIIFLSEAFISSFGEYVVLWR